MCKPAASTTLLFCTVRKPQLKFWLTNQAILLPGLSLTKDMLFSVNLNWCSTMFICSLTMTITAQRSLLLSCSSFFISVFAALYHYPVSFLTLSLPWVTKTEFLHTVSLQYQPTGNENKEKYQVGDNRLIQHSILGTKIIGIVWLTVWKITNLIWEFKGWWLFLFA